MHYWCVGDIQQEHQEGEIVTIVFAWFFTFDLWTRPPLWNELHVQPNYKNNVTSGMSVIEDMEVSTWSRLILGCVMALGTMCVHCFSSGISEQWMKINKIERRKTHKL